MVTNEVRFPVYKPVDYTCNSSLSVCPGEAINSGKCTASTHSRQVHFLPWGVAMRLFPKDFRDDLLSKVKDFSQSQWQYLRNDRNSARDVVTGHLTGSDTRIWPIQEQQLEWPWEWRSLIRKI